MMSLTISSPLGAIPMNAMMNPTFSMVDVMSIKAMVDRPAMNFPFKTSSLYIGYDSKIIIDPDSLSLLMASKPKAIPINGASSPIIDSCDNLPVESSSVNVVVPARYVAELYAESIDSTETNMNSIVNLLLKMMSEISFPAMIRDIHLPSTINFEEHFL